jgi:hypothetical protein
MYADPTHIQGCSSDQHARHRAGVTQSPAVGVLDACLLGSGHVVTLGRVPRPHPDDRVCALPAVTRTFARRNSSSTEIGCGVSK